MDCCPNLPMSPSSPQICPPCDDCDGDKNQQRHRDNKRHRRLAGEHSAELRVPLGECKTRRDRMVGKGRVVAPKQGQVDRESIHELLVE